MSRTPKTCILCKHMAFDGGELDYSEYTPGSEWSSDCAMRHWSMGGSDVSENTYVKNMMTAEGCPDFEKRRLR